MKLYVIAFFSFVGISSVLYRLMQPREFAARRAAQLCIREYKLEYGVAVKFGEGDFSEDSEDAKCFLKCFARRIGFFNETGDLQKDVLLSYVLLVVQDQFVANEIIDECKKKIVKGENECHFIYDAYKCFWDGVNKIPKIEFTNDTLEFSEVSVFDVLRCNQLDDEEEIESRPTEKL